MRPLLGALAVTLPLALASDTALAQSAPVVVHHEALGSSSYAMETVEALIEWIDRMMHESALDGPGSGGPSDIPTDVLDDLFLDLNTLAITPPGQVASISNGFLWLVDPQLELQLADLVTSGQPTAAIEQQAEQVLTNALHGAGAPLLSVDFIVDISNGI